MHCTALDRDPAVNCVNLPGSVACSSCPPGLYCTVTAVLYCTAGYTGTGFYCTDLDECQTNNGGCSIRPRVFIFISNHLSTLGIIWPTSLVVVSGCFAAH